MKGKFITTQIMIVCMGNKKSPAALTPNINDRMFGPLNHMAAPALVNPEINHSANRKQAA